MVYATLDLILDKMRRSNAPFYQVKDDNSLIDENNEIKDIGSACASLANTINSLSGDSVTVRVSDKMFRGDEVANGTHKATPTFRISLSKKVDNQSINGHQSTILAAELDKVKLQNEEYKRQLKKIEEDRQNAKIKDLEDKIKELSTKKNDSGPFDVIIEKLVYNLGMKHLGGPVSAAAASNINGINDNQGTEMTEERKQEINQRLSAAIRAISKVDKDYLENLEKIAKIAVNNPNKYKLAVSMLSDF